MVWWSSSSAVYSFHCLAVCFMSIGFTRGVEGRRHHCHPSSCGDLQISYPFRLKGDPATCGDRNYELTCSSGDHKTFMELSSIQYLVKHIDYSNKLIQIIDVSLLSSNCSLPLKFLPSTSLDMAYYYSSGAYAYQPQTNVPYFHQIAFESDWISVMKCSKKLTSERHQLFPCQTPNDSYVYGVFGSQVADLAPSCSFLSWVPTFYNSSFESIRKDIFNATRDGFFLSWEKPGPVINWSKFFLFCRGESSRFVFAPLSLGFFLAHKFWSTREQEDTVEKFLRTQPSLSPTRYAYTDIITITRNFRERLGSGGFGAVYKGELPGGHFIAVKMLSENSKFNGDDFINEVSTIGRIHHVNVVRLLGFCSDGSKRALIYEYMPMGSLEKYIFSADKTPNHYFSWKKLNSIALGVARGINYLHRCCDMTILHFDIKPQNILLDHRFKPKISDFGLAKLYPKEHDVVSISVARGTIGYIAPELVSRSFGLISHKSDVYSFGMMLLEMGAGQRNVDNSAGRSSQAYNPSLIYDKLNNININVKEGIGIEHSLEMNEVEKKLYIVGFWCIQIRPSDRPSMSDVVQMLEGDVDALQLPPKPFFSSSPSISIMPHSKITVIKEELPAIDEDNRS